MSEFGLLLDDFGFAVPRCVLRRRELVDFESWYLSSGLSVFDPKSTFAPMCFVNGSCGWRLSCNFVLCADCSFKFQSRLVPVVFDNPFVGKPLVRVKRKFQINASGKSVKERENGEVALFV